MLILQMKIPHQEKDKEEMYNCTGINISKWKYINEKKKEWYKDIPPGFALRMGMAWAQSCYWPWHRKSTPSALKRIFPLGLCSEVLATGKIRGRARAKFEGIQSAAQAWSKICTKNGSWILFLSGFISIPSQLSREESVPPHINIKTSL